MNSIVKQIYETEDNKEATLKIMGGLLENILRGDVHQQCVNAVTDLMVQHASVLPCNQKAIEAVADGLLYTMQTNMVTGILAALVSVNQEYDRVSLEILKTKLEVVEASLEQTAVGMVVADTKRKSRVQ